MAVISSIVFTKEDIAGNMWTEGYFLYDFASSGYPADGENMDLSNFFRRIEFVQAETVSGALDYLVRANAADFPGDGGSGRLIISEVVIASGHRIVTSGVTPLMSGLVSEIASGVAVSGMRAYVHALGY